jgi:hypothetical protein
LELLRFLDFLKALLKNWRQMNSISTKSSADNPGLLTLTFHGGARPELYRSEFHRGDQVKFTCVRGKTAGAIRGAGTFQWTSAVKALALILCKVAAQKFESEIAPVSISGQNRSLASSLDYAISKQPAWLIEMFGVDSCSNTFLRRVLHRSNPERKLPGPVIISVNPKVITHNNLECWWDGKLLDTKSELMKLIALLESDYEANRGVMARAA